MPGSVVAAVAAAYWAVILLWLLAAAPFAVDAGSLASVAAFVGVLGALRIVAGRLPDASANKARICGLFDVLLLLAVYSPATLILAYLSVTVAPPFADAALSRIDGLVGFDFQAAIALFERSPLLARILGIAYGSFSVQVAVVAGLLAVMAGTAAAHRFAFAFLVSLLVVIACNMVWPAMGGYVHHAVACTEFPNLNPAPACVFAGDVLALREGSFATLSLQDGKGILTFPSFHTVLGVLVWHHGRDLGPLRVPVRVLSALMIVSSIPVGGHYLVDVVAGIVLGLGAIRLAAAAEDACLRRGAPAPCPAQTPLAEGARGR